MEHDAQSPRLRIRIIFDDARMIGPGKAELLERIDSCGSIAAAGRDMGMSYKRAWQLIGTLNAMFKEPVVDSTRGGPGGGRPGWRRRPSGHAGAAQGCSRRKTTIDRLVGSDDMFCGTYQ